MHFNVLVVGTQSGRKEVEELLFPYWYYPGKISDEEKRADRFTFQVVNLEEAFELEKLRNPHSREKYETYINLQDWAEQHQFLSYEEEYGWGFWWDLDELDGKWGGYLNGGRWI